MNKKFEKPRIARLYRAEDKKKIVAMISGKYVAEIVGISHESLSVIRNWCYANGYSVDESRLTKPNKPKVEGSDEDLYTY